MKNAFICFKIESKNYSHIKERYFFLFTLDEIEALLLYYLA